MDSEPAVSKSRPAIKPAAIWIAIHGVLLLVLYLFTRITFPPLVQKYKELGVDFPVTGLLVVQFFAASKAGFLLFFLFDGVICFSFHRYARKPLPMRYSFYVALLLCMAIGICGLVWYVTAQVRAPGGY